MPSNRSPADVIAVDVLVIGGGFGGVWAALRAAECGAGVVLIDKARVSRSGASTMSGGVTTCPQDGDDLDIWATELIVRGGYMCNQDWTRQLLEGQKQRVRQLAEWGVPISRDDSGNIRRFASRGMVDVRCMQYRPKAAMQELRQQALNRGVTILDRVTITDLLTSDGCYPTYGEICGAVGFNVRTGQAIAIRAKRTVLATGTIAMKGTHRTDNDTGDGAAMAFRAGARMVDLEFSFGGTFSVLMREHEFTNYNVAVAHGAHLINARGERFMTQYDPVRFERSELSRVVAAFAKEIADGRGPVFVDLRHLGEGYWDDLRHVSSGRGSSILLSNHIPNPRLTPLPIEPTWGLWNGGRSGLKIDLKCHSSLPGLLAAGVVAKNDASGTHASAGIPTAHSMNTGYTAGETAALEARGIDMPSLSAETKALVERMFAPLARSMGAATADWVHDEFARLEAAVTDSMQLDATRLGSMIARVDELAEMAWSVAAADLHDLVKVHEARSVAACARMVYTASLDRTESREQFHRADYPDTDDENWFCWHGLTLTASGPVFDREPIDLSGAKVRPDAVRQTYRSPIAAIMSGTYDPKHYDE